MPQRSRASSPFNVSLLILLHLAVVLPLAYFLNIWADEASTLYTTQHGFWTAFQNAATDEKQAPLYFWILSLWRVVSSSIFAARLFSVICCGVAIKLFAGIAGRLFEPRAALLVTAFFALHPFLIWASLEIRVYALVILLSVILIRRFLSGFWETGQSEPDKRRTRQKIWFLYAAIIAVYTNYYLGFILIGFFVALVVSRKWREARNYLGLMIIAGIAFFPLVFHVWSQFRLNTAGFQGDQSIVEGVRYLWNHTLTFVLPAEIFPGEQASAFAVVRGWIARAATLVLIFLTVKYRRLLRDTSISLGAIAFVIGLFLLGAYFVLGHSYVEIRHASVLFVPLILFIASVLSDVFQEINERTVRIAMLATGILVLVSFSYSLTHLYPNTAKRGDWARVAAFLQQNESPNQPIIVFTTFDALALPQHYHGVNRILPDERFFSFHLEAEFGTKDSLRNETDFVISEIPPDADKIWVAVNEKCIATEACLPLENFLQANYTIEIEKEFYLERLYLLNKKRQ